MKHVRKIPMVALNGVLCGWWWPCWWWGFVDFTGKGLRVHGVKPGKSGGKGVECHGHSVIWINLKPIYWLLHVGGGPLIPKGIVAGIEDVSRRAMQTWKIWKDRCPNWDSTFQLRLHCWHQIVGLDHCWSWTQLFPGLIYHMLKLKDILLIFVSRKIVLTSAKGTNIWFFASHSFTDPLYRSEKESTLHSIPSTWCYVSSGNLYIANTTCQQQCSLLSSLFICSQAHLPQTDYNSANWSWFSSFISHAKMFTY